MHPLYEVGEHNTKFFFFFLHLETVLSDLTPENFAIIWQILICQKWNWIRSLKFETVPIHFLSDVFSLLLSRNFAILAMWCNY